MSSQMLGTVTLDDANGVMSNLFQRTVSSLLLLLICQTVTGQAAGSKFALSVSVPLKSERYKDF